MEPIPADKTKYRNILFCTDFSENADFAFPFALDAAIRRPGCELHLLHVIPQSDSQFWKTYIYEVESVDEKARNDIDERMLVYTSQLPEGLKMNIEIRIGRDSEAILDFAREKNIDLIVMGRHGSSGIGTAIFGNVAERVVRKAHCAILIIPMDYKKRADRR